MADGGADAAVGTQAAAAVALLSGGGDVAFGGMAIGCIAALQHAVRTLSAFAGTQRARNSSTAPAAAPSPAAAPAAPAAASQSAPTRSSAQAVRSD